MDDTQECRAAFEKWCEHYYGSDYHYTVGEYAAYEAAYNTRANLDAEKLREVLKDKIETCQQASDSMALCGREYPFIDGKMAAYEEILDVLIKDTGADKGNGV